MPWARLDDRINNDAKLLALSDPAHRMFMCGLAYCAFNLTDGFIPSHAIHAFGVRAANKGKVADELCAVLVAGKKSLWRKVDGGYQVNDYLDWNDSRETVLRERAAAKERLDRHRERRSKRVMNAVVNAVSSLFNDGVETRSEQVSTYHVPLREEKQERADADTPHVENERVERLNARIRQHRRNRSRETDTGEPAEHVITALARDVLSRHPDERDDGELSALLKDACARANLLYDATTCGAALDRAKAQARKAGVA